jgi:hypothetical protein
MLCFPTVPDIVFLRIGENDITAATDSNRLATDILSIWQYFRDGVGVRLVIIGQLIRRMPYDACADFNATMLNMNKTLDQLSKPLEGIGEYTFGITEVSGGI